MGTRLFFCGDPLGLLFFGKGFIAGALEMIIYVIKCVIATPGSPLIQGEQHHLKSLKELSMEKNSCTTWDV